MADSPMRHSFRTMQVALDTWCFHIVGQAGYKMGALMPRDVAERRYQGDAAKVAEALFQAVHQQAFLLPSFISLMIFRIQQVSWEKAAEPDSYDYACWKGQGWFDPDCTFYIEHRANPVKVALARLAGAVVARFVA